MGLTQTYSRVGKIYPKQEAIPIVAPCSKDGLCDPEPGSFAEHCRLCDKVG